jgi:hypothetical protein
MDGSEVDRKCEDLMSDEDHSIVDIVRVEPPILDGDQKLVVSPVSAGSSFAFGSGLDPAQMKGPGLEMIYELYLILDPTACSLVPLDRQGAGHGYAAVPYEILHAEMLVWITSARDLDFDSSGRLIDLRVDVAAWISLWNTEHVVTVAVSSRSEDAKGIEFLMKPLEYPFVEKDRLPKLGHLNETAACRQDPLAKFFWLAWPEAVGERQKSV